MTREEAIEIINRENNPNNKEVWEVFPEYREALDMAIKALEQEPCDDAITRILKRMWNCRGKHTTSIDKVKMEQIIRDELLSVKPQETKTEIEELDYIQEHKKIPIPLQVQKYCDRNICIKNEYDSIGCDGCEVTKSQEPCDDAISRQAVLDVIYDRKSSFTNDFAQGFFADKIRELPPVNSIRPDCENCKKVTKAYFDGQYYADSLEVEEQEPKTDEENIYREREQAYMQGYEDACKKYRQEPKTGHWIETDSDDACWYMCSECHRRTDDKSDYCPNCGASMVEPQKSEEQA